MALAVLPAVALLVDLLVVSVTLYTAALGRDRLGLFAPAVSEFGPRSMVAAPLIAIGWVVAIAAMGGYERRALGAGTDEFRRVVNASFLTAAVIGIGCFVLKFNLSRGFFVLAVVIGPVLLLLARVILRQIIKHARENGAMLHRVVIVGTDSHIDDVAAVLAREKWLGYDVIGALTPAGATTVATPCGIPVLGNTSRVSSIAHEVKADVAFFAGGAVDSARELRQFAWELEHTDCHVVVAPSLTDVSRERISVRPVGGLPLLHLEKPRGANAARRAKRTFDIVGSTTLLLLLSPLLAFAALRVRLHDRGPVFFHQQRIGRDGQSFPCWKFRTMVTDAEARLIDLHSAQGSAQGVFVKIKNDPRVTRPGRWLRRFSFDELPQLFNVLHGEMSLVGPRPQVAHEVALYDSAMARRLHVRPGMTGLWQVSGRSDLSLEEAIRLDLYYVDNWSMVQDLTILARTFGAVFGSRGAY